MRNKFTDAEVEELVASVKANPENLSRVFRQLSNKWGTHSVGCISHYYYKNVKDAHPCFLTVGEKKAFLNRKIVSDNIDATPVNIRESLWSKIKRFFHL